MNFSVIWNNFEYLMWGVFPDGPLGGVALTLIISLAAGILSTILGIIFGIGLTILKGWTGNILKLVLGFLRAIPILMFIFWTYFLLPVLFNVDIPATFTVIIALSLIGAAYIAHSVYAGMTAISAGQWQAATSLGLGKYQVIFFIILPQALRMMLPSFVNQWIAMIKDSSLAYIVGVSEFTFLATQVNNRSMVYATEVFLFVIAVYFIICLLVDAVMGLVNRYLLKKY
ncbi:amino acid ABC transporter permease [Zophobihabitans entericus]|uniref:Amino acid ABC transporter permease n=1 Tax=Zophobihabitans entericus TaxID=1635327 RepID=A0A6G9ICW9_9GAMM|nr:amino acid ABC transporter permease [Zophobihabitans entericus]QIQ21687.1 amino acid ABC transporter permease [Zophobihabitans entericus]